MKELKNYIGNGKAGMPVHGGVCGAGMEVCIEKMEAAAMGLFGKKRKTGGFMDVIRCDEPSYLIWKWHPAGSQQGGDDRENSIRWGSSLRVKDGEAAVFVYRQGNGTMEDFIVGPFDQTIETKNFPVLAGIVGLAYDRGTPFQAEIYFINLAQVIQVKFGVPFFDVYDPRYGDFGVPVAVRGTITFKVTDFRGFIKLHRLSTFNLSDFQNQIRDVVTRYVKDAVANAPAEHDIPLVQIETRTALINDTVELYIKDRLREDFGVDVSGVDIGAIELDKSSEGYRYLMSVTRDLAGEKAKAETADYVERLRIQREEGQYSLHKQTQSANLGAFQTEKQAEVGIAGARALGEMGANGAGNVNLGGGDGFNMAAMMAGMAVGGTVGQNIAGSMNQMMQGMNNSAQTAAAPPPIPAPSVTYYVAASGQAAGPYDINTIQNMILSGRLTKDTLVWTKGMEQWVKAGMVESLQQFFSEIPPVPPIS